MTLLLGICFGLCVGQAFSLYKAYKTIWKLEGRIIVLEYNHKETAGRIDAMARPTLRDV